MCLFKYAQRKMVYIIGCYSETDLSGSPRTRALFGSQCAFWFVGSVLRFVCSAYAAQKPLCPKSNIGTEMAQLSRQELANSSNLLGSSARQES